ncbi:hypothetical protein [Kribbella sp. NPDC050470]|uniref:hypothetical protein n=1 Tax=unclassified Kribbella TaxID=2644121 RepID=UPI0037A28469
MVLVLAAFRGSRAATWTDRLASLRAAAWLGGSGAADHLLDPLLCPSLSLRQVVSSFLAASRCVVELHGGHAGIRVVALVADPCRGFAALPGSVMQMADRPRCLVQAGEQLFSDQLHLGRHATASAG